MDIQISLGSGEMIDLMEAISDVTTEARALRHYSGDTRSDVALYCSIAFDFWVHFRGHVWAVTDEMDYLDTIKMWTQERLEPDHCGRL